MSSTSRSARKPTNILDKRVPKNPKYQHVPATVDTGASVSRYTQRIEEMRKNYKYKKDEIFKRMKVTTLVQLILQVAEAVTLEQERNSISMSGGESVMSDETLTGNEEPNTPYLLNLEDDEERPDSTARNTARSTLESLIHGVGEVDIIDKDEKGRRDTGFNEEESRVPEVESLPYLLLDVRDEDAYKQCHIIGALSYPASMLSRSYNYFTKEILTFKNKLGKIIILYDENERLAPAAATTFVQREVDNVFMLSGGLKVLYKRFPEGLLTGTVPQSCLPTPPPSRKSTGKASSQPKSPPIHADQKWFNPEDLIKLSDKLDDELLSQDKTSRQSSRMSSRSGASSAASRASTSASSATSRSSKPHWK
ncbi:centrosomal protein of 41 kDa-like isoform X1 [Acropora millepora]|uniref:centrosomal protein of 41 kDa-like isoform X1 n=2 Tax=Acropora millepora TaxID=45264 RepID=UPI001CF0FA52|nr:centrosomal protein of 41 kDa-like isoform X1 [Acropora millepora]XP_029185538.2 centrosomal protein of 41 kDa-like isoform X1 [Acropora millepora]